MKRIIAYCTIAALTFPLVGEPAMCAAEKGTDGAQAQKSGANDTAGVSALIDSVNKAIAAADAQAFAALWGPDGNYTDSDGNYYQGRESLKKRFAEVFAKEKPNVSLKPSNTKLLSPTVAVSEGVVLGKEGNVDTRYNMVLSKQAGKWVVVNASETTVVAVPAVDESAKGLKPLEWMLGDWKAVRDGMTLDLHVDWVGNKNFLCWTYRIEKAGQPTQDNTEVIAFDPRSQETVSWSFDSTGAFGESVWSNDGKKWEMQSIKTAPNGTYLTATNIIKPNDKGFTWQSTNRTSADMPMSDTNELQIERVSR